MEKINRRSFIFNVEWQEILLAYPAEVRLEVYDAVIRYAASGTLSELKPMAKMAFSFIKKEIDYNNDKYNETISKRSEAGKKGMSTRYGKNLTNDNKTNKCYQDVTNLTNVTVNDNDNVNKEKDNSNELSKKKSGDQCSDKDPLPVDAPPAAEEKEKSSAKKEKEKIKFAEYVTMTNAEHQALIEKFGEQQIREMIEILDNYKGANGKRYKSDYRAILSWVAGEYAKRKQERERNNGNRNMPPGMIYRNPRQEEEILKKYGL